MKEKKDVMESFNGFMDGIERLKKAEALLEKTWHILGPYARFLEKGIHEDPKHTPVIILGHLGCTDLKEFDTFMNEMHYFFNFDDSE